MVVLSFLIATPIAWFAADRWLQNFAYRGSISWYVFFIAGLLALLIAVFTISWQTMKAAWANPVKRPCFLTAEHCGPGNRHLCQPFHSALGAGGIQWWIFAVAGSVVVMIALLTVSWQATRAALANPVDSLRDE